MEIPYFSEWFSWLFLRVTRRIHIPSAFIIVWCKMIEIKEFFPVGFFFMSFIACFCLIQHAIFQLLKDVRGHCRANKHSKPTPGQCIHDNSAQTCLIYNYLCRIDNRREHYPMVARKLEPGRPPTGLYGAKYRNPVIFQSGLRA